jgi:hypothetical protein
MPPYSSRFADLARWQAMLIIAVTALLMATGFAFRMHNKFLPGAEMAPARVSTAEIGRATAAPGGQAAAPLVIGDLELYRNITERMAAGTSYYAAAADEHRRGGFPLRPFITVRMPTLAMISAPLGPSVPRGLLIVLVAITGLVWFRRLRRITDAASLQAVIGTMLVGTALVTSIITANLVVSHEVWAGTLMALSWGLHRSGSQEPAAWLPSVLIAAIAVLIRETALPFILLMAAFAVWQRDWRQVTAWLAAVVAFAGCLMLHASNVAGVVTATDMASPGWTNLSGWPFFVLAMHGATMIRIVPEAVSPFVVPLVMLGWAAWRTPTGAFGFLLFAGYALTFSVLGRPDNWYWGLLLAPVFALGLLFLPQGIADLWASLTTSGAAVTVGGPATGRRWPTTAARPASTR